MVETYKKEKVMDDNLRKLLVESVLQYCIMNSHDLSVTDCASISLQICEVFPGELASYYYLERKNAAPLGKLYKKFRNWKVNFNRKTKTSNGNLKKQKQRSFSIAEDEDEHAIAYQEKISHWRACSATRMNSIRNAENNPKQIFDLWPQYKLPGGFHLK
ncbi:PREDICTED: uncharacterized protein LOC108365651 [Rhagoletis zephyria]|uniref:uncharacterized protein LOC108365651 n=1 Tax=Rhagoletis zephyria TaxID=28612 RepID=UPI000811230B|nr:PREDICTED: uncharacterized protein LOC108365651 [Rhagoletis zephyria]